VIVCANVASAILSRATTRRHELAVRLALGASRWQLVRQSLVEGLLIAAFAGGLGLVLADTLLGVLLARAPGEIPRLGEIAINRAVVAFAAALTLLTTVVFGLVPWLRAEPVSVEEELRRGQGRSATGRARAGAPPHETPPDERRRLFDYRFRLCGTGSNANVHRRNKE
jgi:putative ABC transport system permease protein